MAARMAASRLRWSIFSMLLLAVVAATLAPRTAAHSSCVEPLEYTWSNACRRGGVNGNIKWCPGPCPRDPVRKNYKVTTYRRGQWFKFVYYRNNHQGAWRGPAFFAALIVTVWDVPISPTAYPLRVCGKEPC